MKNLLAAGGILFGALLAVFVLRDLKSSDSLKYHNNPFGLMGSAYGTLLARLSQKNLDRAWHYGAVGSELSPQVHFEGDGHDHAAEDTEKTDHSDDETVKTEGKTHDEAEEQALESGTLIEEALEFLIDLDSSRFKRTSPFALTEAHKKRVAQEIDKMLLRSYNMDPTDFGVYNTYFYFLTLHEMRGREEDQKRAFSVSENTYQKALNEEVDPLPWLTAASAVLNQFLLEQRMMGRDSDGGQLDIPDELLEKYKQWEEFCLLHFVKLREEAIREGRWQMVPEERRLEAEDRARRSMQMAKQFEAMLKRNREKRRK